MSVRVSDLRQPEPSDKRRRWLEEVVGHFYDDNNPTANRATIRLAEFISKDTGHDGICRTPRRDLMARAGIPRTDVCQRALRELEEAGFLHRLNPGAPPRHPAAFALVLGGTLIRGGDVEEAPRFEERWGFTVERAGRGRFSRRFQASESEEEGEWLDEPRPCCEHTLRTCSPDCPEWGGR